MSNTNTILSFKSGVAANQIPAISLATTTETIVSVNTNTTGVTAPAVLAAVPGAGVNSVGNPFLVGSGSPVEINQNSAISSQSFGRKVSVGTEAPYFTGATFDAGRPFKLRLSGTATVSAVTATTVTNTVAIGLYVGSSVVATQKIATVAAFGTNSSTTDAVTKQFNLEATVQWDSVSQAISGVYGGQAANTLIATAALSNAVAVTSAQNLVFVPSVTFGNVAGGVLNISEFSLEQI